MPCPKCGETRLIERVDTHRWFCAVCAHTWTIGPRCEPQVLTYVVDTPRRQTGGRTLLPARGPRNHANESED
jgi:ribosomal protein L37AE/L43A